MPLLTRLYLKASLIFLVLALLAGLLLAARPAFELPAALNTLSPVYFHLFLVGWITQLIFGVVYWMFPKYTRERPRGSEALGWITFVLLNLGLALRVLSEPWQTLAPSLLAGGTLALSALLQWIAGIAFVINTWPRVKER